MRCERASKRRFLKGCVPLACAAPVILALPKRICSILPLPRLSMWFVRWHGSMGMNWLPHASRLTNDFVLPLKKFPNSVKCDGEPHR